MESLEKGYFKTGDLAKFDSEGWIYLQGRIEDMVYINDLIVSPMNIENNILIHPFVHDVVIIGNKTELVVCIERKPDSKVTNEHIMAFIHKKMPEYQKLFSRIMFFDELPRTSAGKVKKRELREEILQVKMEYTTSLASINTTNNYSFRDSINSENKSEIA